MAFIQKDLKALDELHQDAIIYSLLTSLQIHNVEKDIKRSLSLPLPAGSIILGLFLTEAA